MSYFYSKSTGWQGIAQNGSLALSRASGKLPATAESCPTLCDPIDGSPSGSTVPGIFQARTLERVAIYFSNAWKWKVKVKSLSRVWLLATPWTAAYRAPPSMGFSRHLESHFSAPSWRVNCSNLKEEEERRKQVLGAGNRPYSYNPLSLRKKKINTTVLSFQNFVSCLKSKITSVEIHGCVKQNNTKFKIFNDLNVWYTKIQ